MTAAPRQSSWHTGYTPLIRVAIGPAVKQKPAPTMMDAACTVLGVRHADIVWRSRSMSDLAIRTRTRTVIAAIILNRMGYGTPEIAELFGRESHTTVRDMVLKDPKTPSIDRLVSMMWTLIREGWMHGAEQAVDAAEFDIHRKGK
jgi:chromosomal replication initiation ATPase DnaA